MKFYSLFVVVATFSMSLTEGNPSMGGLSCHGTLGCSVAGTCESEAEQLSKACGMESFYHLMNQWTPDAALSNDLCKTIIEKLGGEFNAQDLRPCRCGANLNSYYQRGCIRDLVGDYLREAGILSDESAVDEGDKEDGGEDPTKNNSRKSGEGDGRRHRRPKMRFLRPKMRFKKGFLKGRRGRGGRRKLSMSKYPPEKCTWAEIEDCPCCCPAAVGCTSCTDGMSGSIWDNCPDLHNFHWPAMAKSLLQAQDVQQCCDLIPDLNDTSSNRRRRHLLEASLDLPWMEQKDLQMGSCS